MRVKKNFPDARLPERAGPTESGADVFVYRFDTLYDESGVRNCLDYNIRDTLVLRTNDRVLINTGLSVAVDPGYEIQVRARSGNAFKKGLIVVNGPGTVDCTYRGPVGVIIANIGHDPQEIKVGDKIAQLVECPVVLSPIEEVQDLDSTARGAGGFGSTDEKN